MLFINDVPMVCINRAAIEYHVPAAVIVSILKTEGGRVGQANRNTNQTFDYGPMQINSSWLPLLKQHGLSAHDLQYNSCVNVKVGTWILAMNIADGQTTWEGIGDYHSHTPLKNSQYRYQVFNTYTKLVQTINS